MLPEILFLGLIAIVAFLYASVGHGGASGYLALMFLFHISAALMKPSALLLNLFVSSLSFYMYYRQGYFNWRILLPFIVLSIPLSFIGARIKIDESVYKTILGICLAIATLRLLGVFGKFNFSTTKPINYPLAIVIGGALGLISGMIGIGGGILLSPVILLLRWANIKQAAAISAAFIFVNSVSGLAGASAAGPVFSPDIVKWVIAGVVGGSLGAFLGSRYFNFSVIRYILSFVLLFASYKLLNI